MVVLKKPRRWGPAPKLGAVAQAAAAAGASAQAVAALRHDTETQREERRTAGGPLDAARARAQRAARHADDARAALAKATQKVQEAELAEREAREELADVEISLAKSAAGGPTHMGLCADVRALLDALESAPVPGVPGTGPMLPERVLTAMAALRRHVDAPLQPARLDGALESGSELDQGGPPSTTEEEPPGADTITSASDEVDVESEEALLALAKPLKRARCQHRSGLL